MFTPGAIVVAGGNKSNKEISMALSIQIRGNRWYAAGTIANTGAPVTTVVLNALILAGRIPVVEKLRITSTAAADFIWALTNGGMTYKAGVSGELNNGFQRNLAAQYGNASVGSTSPDPGLKIIGDATGGIMNLITDGDAGLAHVFMSGRMEAIITPIAEMVQLAGTIGFGQVGNYWIVCAQVLGTIANAPFLSVPANYRPVIDEILPVIGSQGNGAGQVFYHISQSGGSFLWASPMDGLWQIIRPSGAPGSVVNIGTILTLVNDVVATADEWFTIIGHLETN